MPNFTTPLLEYVGFGSGLSKKCVVGGVGEVQGNCACLIWSNHATLSSHIMR